MRGRFRPRGGVSVMSGIKMLAGLGFVTNITVTAKKQLKYLDDKLDILCLE